MDGVYVLLYIHVCWYNLCALLNDCGVAYDFTGEKSGMIIVGSECILVILCSAALFEDAVDTCVGVVDLM
jgi:hypothetical protein